MRGTFKRVLWSSFGIVLGYDHFGNYWVGILDCLTGTYEYERYSLWTQRDSIDVYGDGLYTFNTKSHKYFNGWVAKHCTSDIMTKTQAKSLVRDMRMLTKGKS